MKLSLERAAQLAGGKLFAGTNAVIESVTTDTREIKKGALFVALKGERFDGHDFAEQAIEKGAVGVLSQKGPECFSKKFPLIVVDDTYKSLLKLAAGVRQSLDISVVGVTGSVGKTTTKDMIASVLSSAVKTAKTQENLNNHIGVPKTIFSLENDDRVAVIEMGMNHSGEISVLTSVARPDIAVITCIGVSHIENLKTREKILAAKLEILEGMRDDAPLIINADNDLLGKIDIIGNHRILGCSAEGNNAFVTATDIVQTDSGCRFKIIAGGEYLTDAFISALGIHNVQNALLAAAVGFIMGLSGEQIKNGLANYTPSGMRQKITKICNMTFIEDCYNASPTSMTASLDVLESLKQKRAIAVLGDMLELGEICRQAHAEIGQYAAKKCDLVLCTGNEAVNICNAAKKSGCEARWFESRQELEKFLLNELRQGDCVLFKASHGMHFEKIIQTLYSEYNKNN